ncbi:lectin C-type domain containing protein [Elysia marginata]|uniref:Lectin C-type domain containing protein n=1 Tax=Elysia marginata TaxID=1093978 RepID=A0AAV4EH43_9GAST|nr:lectin C-type domain containing protein [Elysia marginata]
MSPEGRTEEAGRTVSDREPGGPVKCGFAGAAKDVCPYDFVLHQGSCYKIEKANADFFQSQWKCEKYGGYLAEVTSQKEDAFVKDLVRMAFTNNETGVYLGAMWFEETATCWDGLGVAGKFSRSFFQQVGGAELATS